MQLHQLSFRSGRWFRKHRRALQRTSLAILSVSVFTVVLQLLYPAGRILPFVRIEGKMIGGSTVVNARQQLDGQYNNARLALKTDDKEITKSYDEVGLNTESWGTARAAAHYSLGQRFIPFSSLFVMIGRDIPMRVSFDDDRVRYFAQEVEKDAFEPAVNATIAVKGSNVELVPAKSSREYPWNLTVQAISRARFKPTTTVQISSRNNLPERTNDEVKGVLGEAQRAVSTSLSLKLNDDKIKVDRETIGGWLEFTEEPQTKKLILSLKQEAVKKYLDSIQGKIYKAPGVTHIQVIDGREVGRTIGATGKGIDVDKTVVALNEVLKKGEETTVAVPIADLAPTETVDRQYSNTNDGLTALVRDLAQTKGFGISVMELGGRSANANGDKQFTSASTYKLYVAYAVFKQIEAHQMTWNDVVNGRSVEQCFDMMIVKSDNPCATALAQKVGGWQFVENLVRGLGLSHTELAPQLLTTANDLSLLLYLLQNGSLVSPADQSRLLDAMKRQIYRSGIPAGVGVPVADKVGFIDGFIHDAAIVYGPRGPYVLVIMSNGSSWGAIADAARQINTFLNR